MQNILDENEDILQGRNRKERRKLFRAVRDGAFDYDDDLEGFTPASKQNFFFSSPTDKSYFRTKER